ncbi:actin interacting protein 3-domain-containing protein [Jimgerdemannia flammicorona]|uniref:Actin interacting protein 3-domain-containing protein n=1 Tax=Jimgerdemannia flammicorona TaxID=994334 RepID=A0A433DH75_9FUNG|nr:actin interacting protein 3-domain-containing protein [Jimgerdemannia flammicorona]
MELAQSPQNATGGLVRHPTNSGNTGAMAVIEQTVTRLLVATKQLLEGLTKWSQNRMSEQQIYDIYNTLETQFASASIAFESAGIEMSDLSRIPADLRTCIDIALFEDPSISLERHLPTIRDVIIKLLQGLKKKQAIFRERHQDYYSPIMEKPHEATSTPPPTPVSVPVSVPASAPPPGPPPRRADSFKTVHRPSRPASPRPASPRSASPRPASPRPASPHPTSPHLASSHLASPCPMSPPSPIFSSQSPPNFPKIATRTASSTSRTASPTSKTASPTPVLSPRLRPQQSTITRGSPLPPPPPPPPPPLPPARVARQPTLPDSGDFDLNDPKTADALAALKKQENLARRSTVRKSMLIRGGPVPGGPGFMFDRPIPEMPKRRVITEEQSPMPRLPPAQKKEDGEDNGVDIAPAKEKKVVDKVVVKAEPGLQLYLQIGKAVKRTRYDGPINLPALRMLFIERFEYNPRQDNFPSIYIRDPVTQVSYELEDLGEIGENSVLSLNIEEVAFENLQKQITDGFVAVNKDIIDLKTLFSESTEMVKKQLTTAPKTAASAATSMIREVTRKVIAAQNPDVPSSTSPAAREFSPVMIAELKSQHEEVQKLRRDLSIMRQLYTEFQNNTRAMLTALREKAVVVKEQVPTDSSLARTGIEAGKRKVDRSADAITSRLEKLQDVIDELKLDVTKRNCKPSEAQIGYCSKEAEALKDEIAELSAYIRTVKPVWKKTWEEELQNIVREQQFLKEREGLLLDLEEDHEALTEVFDQLKKVLELKPRRVTPREFRVVPAEEGGEGMNDVFKQVQSIDVDSERRLRALRQAEKLREVELSNRIDEFEKELTGFVENNRLKKTGGTEEAERLRQRKDAQLLKTLFGGGPGGGGGGAAQ